MVESKHSDIDSKLDNLIGKDLDEPHIKKLDVSAFKTSDHKREARFNKIHETINSNLGSLTSSEESAKNRIIEHIGSSIEDISEIEAKPKLNLHTLYSAIGKDFKKIKDFQNRILRKGDCIKLMENYVSAIIDTTGPNRNTTALLSSVCISPDSYLTTHSVNVLLISLSTAIELTKLMEDKLTDKEVCSDLQKILICDKKIFNRKELINLGVAAILHDIYLHEKIPKLTKNTPITFREESILDKHPAEAYHLLKSHYPSLDYEIKRGIYQHHEYVDGSGYPNSIEGRLFSKYALILSFTVYYITRITENPFNPLKHPYIVLQQILARERSKFDSDVLLAFIKSASMYPVGSWVMLNTGKIGIVFKSNPKNLKSPFVRLLLDSKFEKIKKKEIDLQEVTDQGISIQAPIPYTEIKKRYPDYTNLLIQE